MNLIKSKTGNLGLVKIIGLVILVLVILFTIPKNLGEITSSGLNDAKLKVLISECELGQCDVLNCDLPENDCSESEKTKWEELLAYSKECNDLSSDEKKQCNTYQKAIIESKNRNSDQINSDFNNLKTVILPEIKYDGNGNLLLSENIHADIKLTISNLKKFEKVSGDLNGYEYMILESKNQNLNPYLVLDIITIETKGKILVSSVGAAGIMQLMPCTGLGLGLKISEKNYDKSFFGGKCENIKTKNQDRNGDERFDPVKNIQAGIKYLKQLSDSSLTSNSFEIAAAYNGGLGSLKESKSCHNQKIYECQENQGYLETRNYVVKFNNYASTLT